MKIRLLLLLSLCSAALPADFTTLCADRTAIERVYYNHRLGNKPPFDQALPRATLEDLVRLDVHKEAVLKKVYDVEITEALVAAEVQRINTTTRAPEMLAELKAALGNDPARFALTVAKPILVERELRSRFDNDDMLHAAQRKQVEKVRSGLLAARQNGAGADKLLALFKQSASNQLAETTWQLGSRPPETQKPDDLEIKSRFGPDAQMLSSPQPGGKDRNIYFEDLPPELRNVLRAQLNKPGDVSAVIETPGSFLLYLAKEKTAGTLSVAVLSIPKCSYEQWLNERNERNP